jgi:site-specific DNA-methyltransferase (adenine-specific)
MSLIKSKKRVADHGEVFTPPWLVEKMLDLVKGETERIDARFLEPACGSGNFLVPVLQRKLAAVEAKFGKSEFERRHYALLALMCCYGIELLADNIAECRANMLEVFADYLNLDDDDELYRAAFFVLSLNLVHGNAMTMRDIDGAPIRVVEWGYVGKGKFQRRDFRLDVLTGMQFDVIIGNPPYQMTGGAGGTSDSSIYHLFVEQAFKFEPRYISMVMPSRWMAGGRGMEEFRKAMLGDGRLCEIVDFPASNEVFPEVEIKAGICYFLWDRMHNGNCNVTSVRGGDVAGPVSRKLDEYDIFVRDARSVSILHKILGRNEVSINTILTRDTAFGLASNFDEFHDKSRLGDVALYYIRKMKRSVGYISPKFITKSTHLIEAWKVLVPEAFNGGDGIPHQIVGKPLIAPPPSVCTQSYLVFYVDSKVSALSLQSYYATRFFRFLVSQRKITQHALHSTYSWVPMQTWDRTWTDEELYKKYNLTDDEQAYVASQVRAMSVDDGE